MKTNRTIMKMALLSISLVLTSAYTISGSLPLMKEAFPERSLASIELLATVPAFSVIFMVVLSGFIAQKIGNKKTVSLGLIIVGIAGVFPFFGMTYSSIFISRLCLGVGLGLINSLAVSMIGFFFDGKEKATLMGFRSSCENLGQAIMTFVVGILLLQGWKVSFLVYLVAFPILILFNLFIKEPQKDVNKEEKVKQSINLAIVKLAFLLFVLVLIYISITIRLSSLVVMNGYGTATQTSTILSFMTISGMIAGGVFGKIYSIVHGYIKPIGISALAIGTIIIALSNNIALTGLGTIVAGVAYPLIASELFNGVSSIAPKNSEVLATSVLLVGCNVGALLAPYGLQMVSELLNDSIGGVTLLAFGVFLIMIALISTFQVKKERYHLRNGKQSDQKSLL